MAAMARASYLLILLCSCFLTGCGASAWERSFQPLAAERPALATLDEASRVTVREVPWERLMDFRSQLAAEIRSSDVPPEEWTAERQLAAKSQLLRALQVTQSPDRVTVVGSSEFKSTAKLSSSDAELATFARSIGANTVVCSSIFTRTRQTVQQESYNEYRWGSVDRGRDGRRRYYNETSTTFVPVVVDADEFAWVAYFLSIR
jgi:hypothetical protein